MRFGFALVAALLTGVYVGWQITLHAVNPAPQVASAAQIDPDIVKCKALADRAGAYVLSGMSVEAAHLILARSLTDHGLHAPRYLANGNTLLQVAPGVWRHFDVAHFSQYDLQAATDEAKVCFPVR